MGIHIRLYIFWGGLLLTCTDCTLEKTEEIPTGVSNLLKASFSDTRVLPDTNQNFHVWTKLNKLGNINIKNHGWVWGERPYPTTKFFVLELGTLEADTFSATISGLEIGKPYYFRPFVSIGNEVIYGTEECSFSGLKFSINTDTIIFQGAQVQFTHHTPSISNFIWNFGDGFVSRSVSPVHTFTSLGEVDVSLSAIIENCTLSQHVKLKVIPDPFQDYWKNIAGGTFELGCTSQKYGCGSDEFPVSEVTLSPFTLGKTEVTQHQWKMVMGNNYSGNKECGANCPVERVSWNEIVNKFLPQLTLRTGRQYRLPTEAEWEYAARGGGDYLFSGTSDANEINEIAWYSKNSENHTWPVAFKKPNGYGLYDMTGNVWEWCHDWYGQYSSEHLTNPSGPSEGTEKIIRGGSFYYSNLMYLRNSIRLSYHPEVRDVETGFRLVWVK